MEGDGERDGSFKQGCPGRPHRRGGGELRGHLGKELSRQRDRAGQCKDPEADRQGGGGSEDRLERRRASLQDLSVSRVEKPPKG